EEPPRGLEELLPDRLQEDEAARSHLGPRRGSLPSEGAEAELPHQARGRDSTLVHGLTSNRCDKCERSKLWGPRSPPAGVGGGSGRQRPAFSAMVYAGLRIEETTALTLGDLSFARGEEEVRVARGKGNKERVVPMSPKLGRSLKRYLKVRDELVPPGEVPLPHLFLNEKGTRVTENTLRRRLYSWVRKSGIKKQDVKPHDLKRTFGTWFLQANPGHVRELAEFMGHSDLSQVMKYSLSDEQRARAGVARL
ncbi:MAG TPA: tyrosine-type recombinase/integrase, partial [Rubrobacter sp.]